MAVKADDRLGEILPVASSDFPVAVAIAGLGLVLATLSWRWARQPDTPNSSQSSVAVSEVLLKEESE